MKKITFVTGNNRKLRHMREACDKFGIEVEQLDLDADEIQSHDPIKISRHKAQQAFEMAGKPIVINDAFWEIPAINGFPGGYMKDVHQWFEAQDFLNLMRDKEDRRISCTETIIYVDADQTHEISKVYWAEIIAGEPRGKTGISMEKVVAVNGRTIAEYYEKGEQAFKNYIWEDFAKWYAEKA